MFNNNQVNARKCAVVLTKVLYLLNHVRHCFKLLEGRGKKLKREEGAARSSSFLPESMCGCAFILNPHILVLA